MFVLGVVVPNPVSLGERFFSIAIFFTFCPVPPKKITTARRSRKSQESAELSLASRGMVIRP